MENNIAQRKEIQRTIDELTTELAKIPSTDTAKRDQIQQKINAEQERLKRLQQQSPEPKTPDRPDWQFFSVKELVEMAIVGGGGALGGLIAYLFKKAEIWTFVPKNAGVIHCMGAGALAAGLAVWFIARTDRNQRVPCFLFAILCGLAGLKMIEKAASTILPEVEIFAPAAIAEADKNVKAANEAAKQVQESSGRENVDAVKANIDKVGNSIENLTKALNTATTQGDTNAVTVLDKSLSEATQSLAKIKFESQSIPEVSKKAEDVLNKTAPPTAVKSAEQQELQALKDKYLGVRETAGWCFLGNYNNNKWERQTTDYKGTPDSLKPSERVTVINAVYLRRNAPTPDNYKLGEPVNVFFDGDEITIAEIRKIQRDDGTRVWAHATLLRRAGTEPSSQPKATATPTASPSQPANAPANPQTPRRNSRRRSR